MARMEIRTREAPMDWERETDRGRPSIFSTPEPLESHSTPPPSLLQRPSASGTDSFGSFNSAPPSLQRDSTSSSQTSFTSGWDSAMPRPFRQDSQLSTASAQDPLVTAATSTPAATTTPRLGHQGSSLSISRENSFSQQQRPHSPSVTSVSSSSHFLGSGKGIQRRGSPSSFDMGSLRQGVVRQEDRSSNRDRGTSATTSSLTRGSSKQLYRTGTSSSAVGSSDEDMDQDDHDGESMDLDHGDEQGSFGRYRGTYHDDADYNRQGQGMRNRHWSQTSDRISQSSRSRIQQQQPQQQDSRTATQQQQQQQQRQRVWSENVDLPYILSGYVQVALNTAVAGVFLYLLYNFIITIQSDVTLRMESMLEREINARQQCNKDFADLNCQLFNKRTSESCREIVDCLSRPEPRISRASVAAETFALIVNAFVHTMSYKTMAFVMVLVFGGLYVSNQAISSYRSNHILHHQHTIVPSASSSSSQSSQQQPQQHIQSNGGFSRRLGQREESNLPLRSTQYRSNEHQQQQNALQRHGSIGSPRPLLLSNSSDEDL